MQASITNRRDWYADPAVYSGIAHDTRVAPVAGAYMQSIVQEPGDYVVPAFDELNLQLITDVPAQGLRGRIDHGTLFVATSRANQFALAPAAAKLRYTIDQRGRFLTISMSRRFLIETVTNGIGGWNGDCGSLHVGIFEDETLSALMRRLWREIAAGSPNGRLCGESLTLSIATLLGTRAGATLAAPAPTADWRLRRAMELLQDDLGLDIGLSQVADAVDLSPRQLRTLFRQHLGATPHAWLTSRRIAAARHLLETTRDPITDIAFATGFSSGQHLANVFNQQVGTTPSAYRRLRGG